MPLPVRLHPEAEYIDAAIRYSDKSPTVGADFVRLVDAALEEIGESPYRAPTWSGDPRVRKRVLARFPYAIFYYAEPESILVVAIEHAKRPREVG